MRQLRSFRFFLRTALRLLRWLHTFLRSLLTLGALHWMETTLNWRHG